METTVNNKWALTLRGILLAGIGILLFSISQHSDKSNILFFSGLAFLAGLAGLGFAVTNKASQVKANWLLMESCADILFSFVAIYFYLQSANLTTDFMTAFACFALLFAFLQVIYIFQLSQIGVLPNVTRIVVRLILAIIYSVFGIVLLFKSSLPDTSTALINFIGVGPLLAGISLLAFSYKLYQANKKLS